MNEKSNVSVNISSPIGAQIQYEGNVKIVYLDANGKDIKTREKHNEGYIPLFTALCRSLVGLNVSNYIPTKLMGYEGATLESRIEAFTQKVPYASTPVLYNENTQSTEACNTVSYTFMVPINNLISRGNDITFLGLFNNRDEECASIDLTEDPIPTNIASNLLVYWRLKFKNIPAEES